MQPGTRHARRTEITLQPAVGEALQIALDPLYNFYMIGLGYGHPQWGHGMFVGENAVAGESWAFRRLVQVGDTSFYALGSIDGSSSAATRAAMVDLGFLAIGATALGLLASIWLAKMVSEPIGQLSSSLGSMTSSTDVGARLPLTGSSRELDALTETFNALMASVAAAGVGPGAGVDEISRPSMTAPAAISMTP